MPQCGQWQSQEAESDSRLTHSRIERHEVAKAANEEQRRHEQHE